MALELPQKLLCHLCVVAKPQLVPKYGLGFLSLPHVVGLLHQLRDLIQQYLWLHEHQLGQDVGEVEEHVQTIEEVQS